MTGPVRCALLVLACAAMTGCQTYDTYRRPGVWHPDDANAANIAAMASRPSDLLRGHGAGTSDGHLAVGAIGRVWQDAAPAGGGGGGGGGAPGGKAAGGQAAGGGTAGGFATPLGSGKASGP